MNLLDQSLCLLDGVSPEAEIRLRRRGVLTCRQLAGEAERYFSSSHAARVRESFAQFETASRLGHAGWFVAHLPPGHRVRALRDFAKDVVFYDIETNGAGRNAHITCITTCHAKTVRSFVRGRNLGDFLEEWASGKLLVGFNSKRFDTPVVCHEFGLADLPAQIDLMDEAAHYGLRGGLKAIEKRIGFLRADVPCSNGEDAIDCWRRFHDDGDANSLKSLLVYNRDDVLSLRHLAHHLLVLSLENTLIVP